jgi:hypothetical protein
MPQIQINFAALLASLLLASSLQAMKSRGTSFLLRENEQQSITAAEVSGDEINRIALRLGISKLRAHHFPVNLSCTNHHH